LFVKKDESPQVIEIQEETTRSDGKTTIVFIAEGVEDSKTTIVFIAEGVEDSKTTIVFIAEGVEDSKRSELLIRYY
jgi:hypothetical protein